MSEVLLTNFEAVRVLAGNRMVFTDLDGNSVTIRLATADEFMAMNRKAIAGLFPDGGGPAPVSLAQAVQLTTPIGGTS